MNSLSYIYIYIYIYIYRQTCTIKEWNKNSSAHPILIELLSGSIGWGAGLQSSRLVQGKSSNPLKVLIKENKSDLSKCINQLNSGWCHTVITFHLYIYIYIYI